MGLEFRVIPTAPYPVYTWFDWEPAIACLRAITNNGINAFLVVVQE